MCLCVYVFVFVLACNTNCTCIHVRLNSHRHVHVHVHVHALKAADLWFGGADVAFRVGWGQRAGDQQPLAGIGLLWQVDLYTGTWQ